MSKKKKGLDNIYMLYRKDLLKMSQEKPNKEVTVYNFKHAVITLDEIHHADCVMYYDNGELYLLKAK